MWWSSCQGKLKERRKELTIGLRLCCCMVYWHQCSGLPEILRQHGASGEFVQSMQSMCKVSIIEPVSSSKYLGSNLKDYCFSSSFQLCASERALLTYLCDDYSPAVTTEYCNILAKRFISCGVSVSRVQTKDKIMCKAWEVIRGYQSDVWLVKSITISWVEQV
jgi:hypothetical protein